MNEFLVPFTDGEDIIIEKKSKFIGKIIKIESEAEAKEHLVKIRKDNPGAVHNCFAYIVKSENIERFSDDGEPQGTAGMPILEVLRNENITNVLCVVTRYFGGTLLGTGGLVRAYTDAAKAGLTQCKTAIMSLGKKVRIQTDYNTIGKVLYELGQRGLGQEDSEYTDVIVLTVIVPIEDMDGLEKKITEISAGKSVVEVVEEVYFEKMV